MTTPLRCPKCSTLLESRGDATGSAAWCPRCLGEVSESSGAFVARVPATARQIDDIPDVLPVRDALDVRRRRGRDPVAVRRKRPFVVGVLMFAGLVLIGLGLVMWLIVTRPWSAPVIPHRQWQTLEVPDRVRVSLPGTAKRTTFRLRELTMIQYWVELDDRSAVYGVAFSEERLPPELKLDMELELLVKSACDNAMGKPRAQGGELLGRQGLQLGPYPGSELVHRTANGRLITRTYLAGGRVYVVIAGGYKLDEEHENVKRLFDSFEIIETGIDAPKRPTVPPAGVDKD